MIPVLSSQPYPSPFSERVNLRSSPLVDYEAAGPTLGAASSSVAFEWKAESDGTSVWVSREGVEPVLVLTDVGITEVSLALDQTTNPHIAYVAGGVAKFRWWDSLSESYQTMTLAGARSPRCCSDEKTPELSGDRDLLLTYLHGTQLFVRTQRERFGVEHEVVPDSSTKAKVNAGSRIVSFGMNTGRRLQWRIT